MNQKSNKSNTEKSKSGKTLKVLLITGLLSYSGWVVLSDLVDVNAIFASSPSSSQGMTLGETAAANVENNTGNDANASSGKVSLSSQSPSQAKTVPLVDVQSFDKLSSLYLLSERVQSSNKPAAELYGLTRLSIHAKRNEAIETELLAKKSKFELDYKTNQSKIKALGNKTPTAQTTPDSNVDSPQNPNYPEPDLSLNQKSLNGETASDGGLNKANEELEVLVYLPSHFSLQAMVNDKASLTIKGKSYRQVKLGQRLLSRFEITRFDYDLECVTIKDNDAKENDSQSKFITCLN